MHSPSESSAIPRWNVTDLHESLDARSFTDAMEHATADLGRLEVAFDEHQIRAGGHRSTAPENAVKAETVIGASNNLLTELALLAAYAQAMVSTDSRDEQAQAAASEIAVLDARSRTLLSRLAEWLSDVDLDVMASESTVVADHLGPLRRLAMRAQHQMGEAEEGLYSELTVTGSTSWSRLQRDVTSQLSTHVALPDGTSELLPMPAVRGLGSHPDSQVRRAAYEAEHEAWPQVAVACAAAMNAIKGEANIVNRRRRWASPLDASLFANSVHRTTFDAMHAAVISALPDFRRWMRTKAQLHGHSGALPWWDLIAPLPVATGEVSWADGLAIVRDAFGEYDAALRGLVDRAVDERWIDAESRDGKVGGAFCMPFVGDRSLVLVNWSGGADSVQTTAHELGHAYHNTQLAQRTPLQRRLPMALAETASIFCETLVVEAGLRRLSGPERLAMLDVDLQGATQVVVDIHSRFLFETEVFARRQRRTLGISEFNDIMLQAQADAYGDGLDQDTAHRHMWIVKPHYYGSHFYNWPYTYGLLFGLGLYARFQAEPDRFRSGYDHLLSRAGMDTAEVLGAAFDIDVTDEGFWTSSLDVLRGRMAEYDTLAAEVRAPS